MPPLPGVRRIFSDEFDGRYQAFVGDSLSQITHGFVLLCILCRQFVTRIELHAEAAAGL
jgi:hypothetical protein